MWLVIIAGVLCLSLGAVLALAWKPLGRLPSGARLARIVASPNYKDGRFRNLVPVRGFSIADVWQMARDYAGGQERVPAEAVPIEARHRAEFERPPASGLRITWLGHSSDPPPVERYWPDVPWERGARSIGRQTLPSCGQGRVWISLPVRATLGVSNADRRSPPDRALRREARRRARPLHCGPGP